MHTYETSATVESMGHLHLAGVPFEPGTPVEIKITPTRNDAESPDADEVSRTARLLAALDKARNTAPVGPLNRAEIYDRDILR